jgi:hypothetical protein
VHDPGHMHHRLLTITLNWLSPICTALARTNLTASYA